MRIIFIASLLLFFIGCSDSTILATSKNSKRFESRDEKKNTRCDSNYSGCVPVASDVDCAGGTGNGPVYISGPVRVIGKDIYRLDGDKDGYGCE